MSLYNGPPRGGSRGGRDQFNWDSVKSDKDRECYLGHSVKALTGRWQKGKDVYWYTRQKGGDASVSEEIQRVKEREADLMAEAMGLKPKEKSESKRKLDALEMQQLLQRGDGSAPVAADADPDGEGQAAPRVRGVGFAPRAMGGVAGREVLDGYDNLPPPPARSNEAAAAHPDRVDEDLGKPPKRTKHSHDTHSKSDKRKEKHRDGDKKSKKEKKEKKAKRRHRSPGD